MRDDWWGSMSCTEKLHHIGDGSERLSSPVRGWTCYSFLEMAGSEVRGVRGRPPGKDFSACRTQASLMSAGGGTGSGGIRG